MRFFLYKRDSGAALGAVRGTAFFGARSESSKHVDLNGLIAAGTDAMRQVYDSLLQGEEIDTSKLEYLPPLPFPEKIICFGLNYRDHATESGFEAPAYPALFGRFPSSLIGHGAPIVRPRVSDQTRL